MVDQLEVPPKSSAEVDFDSIPTPYDIGENVSYKGGDTVTVVQVYLDDNLIPFYDIQLKDGRVKQTTHDFLRALKPGSTSRNSTKTFKKSPGLWKLAGRSIRKGIASTKSTLSRGISTVQDIVGLPEGSLLLNLDNLKVYQPLDKIKGTIITQLNDATTAEMLTVTLRAERPLKSNEDNIFSQEIIFDEEYTICGKQVYQPRGEFPFEIIIPQLGTKRKNDSVISLLVQELKDLRFTGNASWTIFCSLKMPGKSLRTMYSDTFRIHVDD